MAFSSEYHLLDIFFINATLIATIWPGFFVIAPFFSYVKSILLAKAVVSLLLWKNVRPMKAQCSIKKALSQMKTDNWDPTVRESKGQDWSRETQHTHILPTALFLSLHPFSVHPWILSFKYFALFLSLFLFSLHFWCPFLLHFSLLHSSSLPLSPSPKHLVLFCL